MDVARRTLAGTATIRFMALAAGSAFTALSLRPAFIPLIFILSILLNYLQANVGRPQFARRCFVLLATLSVATLTAFWRSTWSALSAQNFLSGGALLVVSLTFCFVALVPIVIHARARAYVGSQSPLSGLLLFPTLWATTWSLFVYISPLGRIGTWSPMTGMEAYAWVTPIFGQAGIDYVTALWAVVLAEFTGKWIMGPEVEGNHELPGHGDCEDFLTPRNNSTHDSRQGHSSKLYILGLLMLGVIPSYYTPILPLPIHSENVTELTVSCVFPYVRDAGRRPSLADYLAETRTQASRAKVVLWPEGAVSFRTDKERADVLEEVSKIANQQKAWIGIGYEQEFSNGKEQVLGKRVRGHNGLVVIGPDVQPVTYIKRKLVPRKCMAKPVRSHANLV